MRSRSVGGAMVVVLALAAPCARAGDVEIRHDPVECVPLDRYERIGARGLPAEQVAAADLQFRVDPDGAWYTVHMKAADGEWSAVLPRPMPALERFEYRVVMTSRELERTATPPFVVRVAADPTECPGGSRSSVSAAIVVSVPEGAPVVPPVPPGFNPTGVVPDEKVERASSGKKWMLLGAAGVAGGLGALAVAGSSESTPVIEQDIPNFIFVKPSPPPTSVLSLSRSMLLLFVEMDHEPAKPLTFNWRFEMRKDDGSVTCVTMSDVFRDAQSPPSLILTAPLTPTGACGGHFGVHSCRLTINVQGAQVFDRTFGFPFTFEP